MRMFVVFIHHVYICFTKQLFCNQGFFFRKNVLLLFSSLASFGAGWVDHNGIVGFSVIGMWEGTSYNKKGAGKKYNFKTS